MSRTHLYVQKKSDFKRILKNVSLSEALDTYRFTKTNTAINHLAFEAILILSFEIEDLYNLLLMNYFSCEQKIRIFIKLEDM